MKDMATLSIEQIFTSYDNPKGNADTERVMRTIKEEIIWVNEFSSLEEAKERIGKWIEVDYNKLYVHSELGYVSPQ
ncbi:MAG: integrase core domain-containing protein, partial [Thermodesulfovibrionales bacterium]